MIFSDQGAKIQLYRMTSSKKNIAPLCIRYYAASDPLALPDENTLAVVSYGETSSVDAHDERRLTVGLPVLHGSRTHEVWRGLLR